MTGGHDSQVPDSVSLVPGHSQQEERASQHHPVDTLEEKSRIHDSDGRADAQMHMYHSAEHGAYRPRKPENPSLKPRRDQDQEQKV